MKKLTAIILALVVVAVGAGIAVRQLGAGGQTVTVVHWTNGHLMRTGLTKEMAAQFNQEVHRTASGQRIKVVIYNHGSAEQSDDLASRAGKGVPIVREALDPTIVTPSSADWLVRANEAVGRTVVDIANSRSITKALIGIVTYRDMAEVLGWPNKPIGYADIIALRNDPQGWGSYPDARAEWGQKPLVGFTDPITSTTGRSVLFSLYAIASGKSPEQLALSDVSDPTVVAYVKGFQGLIDHYLIGTIPLNTKVYQGPRYGHFFLMPEDNLIHLYEGGEQAIINGVQVTAPPIDSDKPMVMIYPKEGSMVRNNIAGIVQAPWVTAEQVDGANKWIDFLRQDKQQRAFMKAGFRPVTDLPLSDPACKINGQFGLDPDPETRILSPELIDPDVAAAIEQSWQDVKKPAIVTFAVDVSGSMSGTKLDQARKGMVLALDSMARNNDVGFLTFSNTVGNRVSVGSLAQNRFAIANAVGEMKVQSNTALYDAIQAAVQMTDNAPGSPDVIRAVVVLTDGRANVGDARLDTLIKMISRDEVAVAQFRGFEGDGAFDLQGREVARQDVIGTGLALKTKNPVQIFYIGIGKDADMEIGRMLAQATGAEFQRVEDKDLASLLEQFSKYF
jgi:Ca-activated chloride channel family protein